MLLLYEYRFVSIKTFLLMGSVILINYLEYSGHYRVLSHNWIQDPCGGYWVRVLLLIMIEARTQNLQSSGIVLFDCI